MRVIRNALRMYARQRVQITKVVDYTASADLNNGLDFWQCNYAEMKNYVLARKLEYRTLCLRTFLNAYPGIKMLGSGCFGVVVEAEGKVYKIIRRRDPAYQAFVDFCLAYGPSQFLPRLDETFVIRGLTVYTMEKLERYEGGVHSQINRLYCDFVDGKFVDQGVFQPELVKVAKALAEYKAANDPDDDLHNDMHSGNFMMRGNQIVITDPWS